ncbi:MAG: prenyltransferase [Halanaerobiaceae bacterium]
MYGNKGTGKDWLEILRPFTWVASIIPIGLGGLFAIQKGVFNWSLFLIIFTGVILLQGAANIVNEYFDYKTGVDNKETQRASMVLVERRINPEFTYLISRLIMIIFLISALFTSWFLGKYGIIIFALIAVAGAYYYTAPPLNLKYRGLGLISIFIIFGLILPQAVYYTFSGAILIELFWLSIPVGVLIGAILYGNDLRDLKNETDIFTIAGLLGLKKGIYLYVSMIIIPYILVIINIFVDVISIWGLLVFFTLPLAFNNIITGISGIKNNNKELVNLDQKTALLHLIFGLLWIISIYNTFE